MLEVNNFNAIRISLASPEKIRDWSHGEVTKPETINKARAGAPCPPPPLSSPPPATGIGGHNARSQQLQRDSHFARLAGEDPRLVARRGDQAGDDQLPDAQAGARRPVLRAHFRS